jgi:uncharacterized protein (TIGR02466 family)
MTEFPLLFPSPILIDDTPTVANLSYLNDFARIFEKTDKDFPHEKYPNGYTSFFTNQHLQAVPELRPLCQHIIDQAKKLYHKCGYSTEVTPIAVTSLWVSIQRKGSQHGLHNHRMAMFSGTYYSSAPTDCANIMFQSPLEYHKMHMPIPVPSVPEFEDDYFVEPKNGRTIIFPGYLQHRVMPHEVDEERIAWSFNINYYNFFK